MDRSLSLINTQADTLNKLRDAMGVDAIVGNNNMEAYAQQAEIITEEQDDIIKPL